MNFFCKIFLLFSISFTSFNTKADCKILSDKFVIGSSVAASVTCATILGLYFWTHRAHKKPLPQSEAEKLLQNFDEENDQPDGALSKTLKLTLIPGAVGGGLYYVLSGYTLNGYLKYCARKAKRVNLGLGEKFSDGQARLTEGLDENVLKRFINSNFGEDSHCPLIEAERYLIGQRKLLQGAVKALYELDSEIKLDGTIIADVKDSEQLSFVAKNVKGLSDIIGSAINCIQKYPEYKDQLAMFSDYKKDQDKKESDSSQRKYELLKILAIIGGASSIAGKIVAPFS